MRAKIAVASFAMSLAFAGCGSGGSGGTVSSGGVTGSGGHQSDGSGGTVASGGTVGSGGTKSSGGQSGSGGVTSSGGMTDTGGTIAATGGKMGSGGASGNGGVVGSGGQTAAGGATGEPTGGMIAAGGSAAGGSSGNGGATSAGGSPGSGGSTAMGGSSGGVDAGATGDAVPSAGCGKTRTLQDGNRTISSGGQNRTYYLKTPSSYDNKHPYRLIFTFHWFYGSINAVVNPPDADHNTDRPFYGLSDLSGDTTIFIAPQGLSDSGGAGWANPGDRDVKFTDDMLAAVSADLCIDTSRVFTTGFSYGGSMSYELACARPDKFRAALLYDPGTLSGTNPSADCKQPIAIFQSHGYDDQTLNYSQGLGIFNVFTKLNGCTAMTPPVPPTNGHTCTSFTGCSSGHPARFCGFGSGENNPYNASLKGHYPTPKDPNQTTSWVPKEAWDFITQF
jgi:predicted esterase